MIFYQRNISHNNIENRMIEKENKIFDYKFYLLFLGLILILFASVYIFTRPSFNSQFDLSNKGEIGDTIGGITAPIINLIGAILVYISFQAQINANKIQYKLLNKEIENQRYDRNFSVALDLINSIKGDLNLLKFKEYQGLSAINLYANTIKNTSTEKQFASHTGEPIYHEWKFLIHEIDLILNHINNSELRENEKEKLEEITKQYYITRLKYSTDIIRDKLEKFELGQETAKVIQGLKKYNKTTT